MLNCSGIELSHEKRISFVCELIDFFLSIEIHTIVSLVIEVLTMIMMHRKNQQGKFEK